MTMADTKVAEGTCLIPTFERNRYFFGKPMTVHDFETEQQYGIAKSRLLNRLIHGTGILCGMQVGLPKIADGRFTVEISEGAALDCCGNLIVANRTETVEVKGDLVEGANYLYVKFAECVRQPIRASANVSSCEEVCCYNRIRETFEVFVAGKPVALPTFTGSAKRFDGQVIVSAKVEALQGGIVISETLTDKEGNFTLEIASSMAASKFDLRASATGFGPSIKLNQTVSGSPHDFVLVPQAETAAASVCQKVTQRYFDEHSSVCRRCDDPRVFLAVANVSEETETVTIDQTETARVRSVLYSNPMLHDLLCDHLADFNNPHRTTAEQVRALQSINHVGNEPGKPHVANITLGADATIRITSDSGNNKIDLKLANNAVKPAHLNDDTINHLLASNDMTIGITPDSGNKRIDLKLANDAVKPLHLNNDTINNLLASDGTITIQPSTADKNIAIKTNPATAVSSVGVSKVVGTSPRFSPDDHSHDLESGVVTKPKLADDVISTLVVASDDTITVTPDLIAKQIRIKANRATEVSVTTGLVKFERVKPGEPRVSPPIQYGLTAKNFAIVLALSTKPLGLAIGNLSIRDAQGPQLMASYIPGDEFFVIHIHDRRQAEKLETYVVRWWAIPSTDEVEEVVSPG